MDYRLFQLDPMAATSYALYNSVKKEEGSFEDFLLSYDSHGANEGDNSWLSDILSDNLIDTLSSKENLEVFNYLGMSSFDIFSSTNYFDTKIELYTLQLKQELVKRESSFDSSPLLSLLSLKSAL